MSQAQDYNLHQVLQLHYKTIFHSSFVFNSDSMNFIHNYTIIGLTKTTA